MRNRDRVASKDDLIAAVWGGRIVSDSTLTSRISAARKAIGDSGEDQMLIRTIPRKGLRFPSAPSTCNLDINVEALPCRWSATGGTLRKPFAAGPAAARPAGHCRASLRQQYVSGDPEQEYFSDGISEDDHHGAVEAGAGFSSSRANSRRSTYKGKAVHLKQIAAELWGRLRWSRAACSKSGDHVRITAQLIDAATGKPAIWAGTLRPRPGRCGLRGAG